MRQQRPLVGQRLFHPLGQSDFCCYSLRVRAPACVFVRVCAGGCRRSGVYSFAHAQPGTRAWFSPSVSPESSLGRAVVLQPSWDICLRTPFLFFWLRFGHAAHGILGPQPGVEPVPPAVKAPVFSPGLPGKSPSVVFKPGSLRSALGPGGSPILPGFGYHWGSHPLVDLGAGWGRFPCLPRGWTPILAPSLPDPQA